MVVIPVDHGLAQGPLAGLRDLPALVDSLAASGVDAVLMNPGAAAGCAEALAGATELGLIVHLSAGSKLSEQPHRRSVVCSVDDALRMGADAVSVHLNVGGDDDLPQLLDLSRVRTRCTALGVPLLAMMYVLRDAPTPGELAHAARMAWELGADLIKIPYPGTPEGLAHVLGCVPCPVVCAGGDVADGVGILDLARIVVEAGGAGLAVGRHVFQHPDPAWIAARIADIVHTPFGSHPKALKHRLRPGGDQSGHAVI